MFSIGEGAGAIQNMQTGCEGAPGNFALAYTREGKLLGRRTDNGQDGQSYHLR